MGRLDPATPKELTAEGLFDAIHRFHFWIIRGFPRHVVVG